MIFNKYNHTKLFIFLSCFILINFQYLFSIIFINQLNLPDGMLHLLLFDKYISFSTPKNLYVYLKNIDLYNISFLKNFIINIFPSLNDKCFMNWSSPIYLIDSCHNTYYLSEDWKGVFGFDTQLYDYSSVIKFGLNEIALFIYLLILNFITFTLIFKNNSNKFIFCIILYLYFPSIVNTFSYISPNIFISYVQIFLFYLFLNKKYLLYFLFSIFTIFMDKAFLPNLLIILIFYPYFFYNRKLGFNLYNIRFLIIYLSIIFLILFFLKNSILIEHLFSLISTQLFQNYLSLNMGDKNFFKSIIIVYLSLYYVGGSMTHLAFLLEHIIFYTMLLFILLIILKYIIFNKFYNSKNNILYFIIGNFVVFYMIILFPNLDQGRYFYFLLLSFIYFYCYFFKDCYLSFYYILPIFFILNNLKLVKFINTGFL